ncbi:endolytic transglycosylase MltG [Candidatus Nomurabacteria bacterium]|nr:endolytic transglycosylase MltG [Candidatus Nomurabacteria bacterium]
MKYIKSIILLLVLLASVILPVFFYYKFDPALLSKLSFYISLANPYVRIVRVQEGLRKEEVAEVVAGKLDWDNIKKEAFMNSVKVEGHYFPKTYLIYKDADPALVGASMAQEFTAQVSKIKKPKSGKIINENTALKVASLIQREAAGKQDMALISGIIWNRIFKGMKLQIDATLQYAKGSVEEGWWEEVDSADKKIKSSYNTYLYEGLPPGAIANPGINAIRAAYNPQKTECLFYLHDKNRKIHCAKTYEQHKKNINMYLK